jgi:quercetin dioxygenase-like cupin family protein
MVVKIEGKADQTFKTGDSFQIPVNAVHDACGVGGQGFKVLGTISSKKASRHRSTCRNAAAALFSAKPAVT